MYVKVNNNVATKYSLAQLKLDNPLTSFSKSIPEELLASYGVYPYSLASFPEYDPLISHLEEGDFKLGSNNSWSLGFSVVNLPTEQAELNIKAKRDQLLFESDWIVTKSYEQGQPVPTDWLTYRQALRDIPLQVGFPYSIVWPTK